MLQTIVMRFGASRFHVHHWETSSDAPPLLALHGFTGDGLDFEALIPHLGDRSVIAPDLLGHGQSSAPHDPELYTLSEQVTHLNAIREALNIETFDLLGYSMGGRLAIEMTQTIDTTPLRRMVLVSTTAGIEEDAARAARAAEDAERAKRIRAMGTRDFIDMWQSHPIIATQARIPDPFREQMMVRRYTRDPEGLANSALGGGTGSMTPWWASLPECAIPALILTGAEDEKYVAIGERLRDALPYATHHTIEGAGHTVHLERPVASGEVLHDFLDAPPD